MLATDKQVKELEAQVEHLQERLDNLRDEFSYLEDFVKNRLGGLIDDRLKAIEDYFEIEYVVEPQKHKYIRKDDREDD